MFTSALTASRVEGDLLWEGGGVAGVGFSVGTEAGSGVGRVPVFVRVCECAYVCVCCMGEVEGFRG